MRVFVLQSDKVHVTDNKVCFMHMHNGLLCVCLSALWFPRMLSYFWLRLVWDERNCSWNKLMWQTEHWWNESKQPSFFFEKSTTSKWKLFKWLLFQPLQLKVLISMKLRSKYFPINCLVLILNLFLFFSFFFDKKVTRFSLSHHNFITSKVWYKTIHVYMITQWFSLTEYARCEMIQFHVIAWWQRWHYQFLIKLIIP